MPYDARVLEVMIASPSDVTTERGVARSVLAEWNDLNAKRTGVVLLPVGWETDAVPQMGSRAQEIINRDVLARCDLLVAVFWTRLGSPTCAAPSGTVEEINEHVSAGKPAMVFFSEAPVRLDSVDDEQYRAHASSERSARQTASLKHSTPLPICATSSPGSSREWCTAGSFRRRAVE